MSRAASEQSEHGSSAVPELGAVMRPVGAKLARNGQPRRVVITGLGLTSSLGLEVEPVWRDLLAGRSGIGTIQQFDSSHFPVQIGAEIALDSLPPASDPRFAVNRTLRFAGWAADRTWEDARLQDSGFDPERTGVCVGAGVFPSMEDRLRVSSSFSHAHTDYGDAWLLDVVRQQPQLLSQQSLEPVSRLLSQRFSFAGPSLTVQAACASATQAIGEAFRRVRAGEADLMLTGGVDSMLSMFCVAGFVLLGALSRQSEPTKASRPFDARRDGFVMGEGAGLAVLEELEHAQRRGARIYAEVIGYGSSGDAYRFTDIDPQAAGGAAAIRGALADAGLKPEEVDYINAHGTSTPQNDRAETLAIRSALGEHADGVAVSSTKSQIGHLICAAGGIELLFTALALRDGQLPPTVNQEEPDPECDLDYVPNQSRASDARVALSNSFGFGGQNATVALRRFES